MPVQAATTLATSSSQTTESYVEVSVGVETRLIVERIIFNCDRISI